MSAKRGVFEEYLLLTLTDESLNCQSAFGRLPGMQSSD
jgi:hypothetical protein